MQTAAYCALNEDADLAVRERTDGELLICLLDDRHNPAFEMLLARYAPALSAAYRYVLDNRQDVEDAFQQTCIVLMRKAASLRDKPDIGCWLRATANHIAQNVKTKKKRRENHEGRCRSCLPAQPAQPHDEAIRHEARDNINTVIQLLPEKLRVPFVLFYLEEKSRVEVARELDLPEGTVAKRLAKARQMIRQELTRRGIIP